MANKPGTIAAVTLFFYLAGVALPSGIALSGEIRTSRAPLEESFRYPPPEARPAGYWAWMNGYVTTDVFRQELEEWKSKGISKAFIFECGARDPKRLMPVGPAFMSPDSVKAIGHAIREAGRVGMELGFTTSSSWNAGGSWVTPEDASMGLFHASLTVHGPARVSEPLPFPAVPDKAPKREDGRPAFYREVAVLAVPEQGAKSAGKATNGGEAETQAKPGSDAAGKVIDRIESIVDVTNQLQADGRLHWEVPPGNWTILRFVCSNTGQQLAIPSPSSQGLAIDHFSAAATRRHFEYLIGKLQDEVGPLKNTALTTMYLCSYELRGAAWTPDFLDQFQRRRGYDMKPYLPVLAGWRIASEEISSRFDYDYRKTQGDLLVDAFYRTAANVCHEHGLQLCAEAGGPGPPTHNVPVDALKAQGAIDIPRGEFWTDQHLWVVKETACASHIYGKRVVDMEAFTSWDHWQYGPFDLKPFADRAMCDGTNHFTFHTSPHHPRDAGLPGWAYHAGTHIAPSIVWWPKAKPFFDYLARCSHLLQEGKFVADVCYYYGDQAFNFVPPKQADPSLGPGYDYDVTNAEVLLTRMNVREGRIVLPDGMSYAILVLPDREDMDLDVLKKLRQLLRGGATVVGRKPVRGNGLANLAERDAEIRRIADEIWGPCNGTTVLESAYGAGKVVWGRPLREILESRGIGQDFSFAGRDDLVRLDFLHRHIGGADVYFIANRQDRWEDVACTFRVRGKAPEMWMPDTGEVQKAAFYRDTQHGTEVRLRLAPFGSAFVAFRDAAQRDRFVAVRGPGEDEATSPWPAIELVGPATPAGQRAIVFRAGSYLLTTARRQERRLTVGRVPEAIRFDGPWTVRFPAGWGAPESVTFDPLLSWPDHPDKGVQCFSGVASYEKEFLLPPGLLASNIRLFLDLGQVQEVADVTLNGQNAGILWKPPFRLEVTNLLQPGPNRLRVEVANTWSNRLVGDARDPDGKQYCRTNITGSGSGVSWRNVPLRVSGLLGPVQLVPAREELVGL